MMKDKVGGIVLAGGMSRRFGSPKAFVQIEGVPFYRFIINAMKPVVHSINIITSDRLLEKFDVNEPTIKVLKDNPAISGLGPLAGIFTAMDHLAYDWYLVSPVDIPFIEVSVYQTLLNSISEDKDAIVPIVNGRLQPLVSVFHQSIKGKIENQLNRKELSLKQLLSNCKVEYIEMNNEIAFRNINYRKDLTTHSQEE